MQLLGQTPVSLMWLTVAVTMCVCVGAAHADTQTEEDNKPWFCIHFCS